MLWNMQSAVLVLLIGVGMVMQPGFAADDKPAVKKDEPAWKAEFRKAYGLKDGQLVKRVAPPYLDCRDEYFKNLFPGRQGNIPFSQWFATLSWKGDWTDQNGGGYRMPVIPENGVPLDYLLDATLGFAKTRIESDIMTLAQKVTGDFVVRSGADREKVALELEAILRAECKLPVKLSFKDSEEEVYILSGKYKAAPLDGRKEGEIEVYAIHLTDRSDGSGSGTLKAMLQQVERHVNQPIALGKIEGEPKKVEWHFNVRSPMLRDPAKGIDTLRDDTNPDAVLANIASQTGLKLTTEKRKVRLLVVAHSELKK
ncbi:MAG: hypothetical protein ACRC8S_09360 [Fimbriiglobus sp.]